MSLAGLVPSTCYIFGIRVYTVGVGEVGEWTLLANSTLAILGITPQIFVKQCSNYFFKFCPIDQCSSTDMQQSSSNTGLVAGSVTLSVIIITLIVLLIVQSMGMIYMKKYVPLTIQTY